MFRRVAGSISGFASSGAVFRVSNRLLSGFGVCHVVFAFCQADVHFDFAAVIVQVERDDGVTRAFGFADEFVDFRTVQQQFALADRIGFDVCGSGRQRGNVAADQIEAFFFQWI